MNAKYSALIIEDDPVLATIFAESLKLADCNPELIYNGNTALDRLSLTVPDLVLLDLHLPGVTGVQILRHIRADKRLKHTLVIIISADVVLIKNLQDEADLGLIKPVGVKELGNHAISLLRRKEK